MELNRGSYYSFEEDKKKKCLCKASYISFESGYEKFTLIMGRVLYDIYLEIPVKNAVVVVEKMDTNGKIISTSYVTTDKSGDFIVKIRETNFYYRLTAFSGNISSV